MINMQLNNVFSSDSALQHQTISKDAEEYFYGDPDIEVVMDEYIDLPVMEEVIREIVPLVYFRKKNNNYSLEIADKDKRKFLENPLLLFDGVPVHNANAIMSLDPSSLKKIEVVRNKYYLQDQCFHGIIHFISKKGRFAVIEPPDNLFRQTMEFPASLSHKFSAPDYEKERNIDDPRPDFRTTLYWNPDIAFSEEMTRTENFYTGDDTGTYSIILEGLDSKGKRIYIEESFVVE